MRTESIGTVVHAVLRQAELTPHHIAVEDGGGTRRLSFAELRDRSAHWARALNRAGVRPGDCVGLQVERSLELAVGLLAILRAGAAYVPLDASYPVARRSVMIGQAGLSFVITDADAAALPAGRCLSPGMLDAASVNNDEALPALHGDALAYVIFTSGSTGTPKGVMLPHAPLDALITWQRTHGGLGGAARTLQFTPVGFDVHFQEFFGTWATGGTLVMVADDLRRDPQRLLRFLENERIERLFLPFVALQQLAEAHASTGLVPAALRDVVTAGEQLVATSALRRFFRQLTQARLHNHYGPSETHVATAYTLPADSESWPSLPSIGTAITGSVALLLDAQNEEVPSGELGEIVLGGACVGAGYIGNAEATASRFVTLTGREGRFYRTGDLARTDEDGNLHFAGRADGQVKIRGHRVEPTEVESALTRLSGVSAAAVIAAEGPGQSQQLLAYIVPSPIEPPVQREEPQPTWADWRAVWDATYTQGGALAGDGADDFSSWTSSYDGTPIPPEQMRKWVAGTKSRILALKPKRVLEVGAGTGLILQAVAPSVERYVAMDYSEVAVARLARAVAANPELSNRCTVARGVAHELGSFARTDAPFDTIVLNSVTQHFESSAYLRHVLQECLRLLPAGGTIFLGDVTCHATRPLFHASVERARERVVLTNDELQQLVERRLAEDRELSVDPAWFYREMGGVPSVRSIEVQLKPGGYLNELSQFRFDVTLHVAPVNASPVRPMIAEWQMVPFDGDLVALRARLATADSGTAVRVCGIPNVRLAAFAPLGTIVGDGMGAWGVDLDTAIDPDALHTLGTDLGMVVQTVFSGGMTFDAIFTRGAVDPQQLLTSAESESAVSTLVNHPYLVARFDVEAQRLQAALREELPDYMVPTRFVHMTRLPLTPSGKLARARLPRPGTTRPALATDFVPPASATERQLADVWQRVLEVDGVGALDNYFELGGTSLLSLQLTTEMSR
ncbi:MAG TPA: amino acid adenylation domain-containing protein, partial [Gemmatimonas sp.]|uniref:amino acid adenylation domain-containing protein n=1 Tax=Gemmatimonas sp. TaxID=1962908 RepID=UPI002ED82B62